MNDKETKIQFVRTLVHIRNIGVASIQLYKVNTPVAKSLSISFQMVQDSWVSTTSKITIVFIYSKKKTLGMDLNI